MNYAIVFRLLGYVLMIEGALLLLPAAASLVYGEWMVLGVFLLTAAVSAGIGYALHTIKPRSKVFYMREGFAATSLCWVFISVMGAVPFVLTGCIPNPVDALFETVSGFTTTGASILPEVESLPKGILFWRSFTHWIGGMGVLVFLLSLLPLTGGSHVNLMKAESPGPQVDKLVPKVQSTAKILYGIYFALTVLEVVFLLLGGMPLFESMLTAFGTAGTGGFGFKNDSFTSFSPYIQWVVTIFMILFGVNFNAYFLLLMRKFRRAAASEEVRGYFVVIAVAVGIITANIYSMLPIKSGDRVNDATLNNAIHTLYDSGLFDDIKATQQGNTLVFNVVERPIISKVEFKGNKLIPKEALQDGLKKMGIAEGEVLKITIFSGSRIAAATS